MSLKENLIKIQNEIVEAAKNAGRNPEEVKLLPVTKTVDIDVVNQAIEYGITSAGENKPQELARKYEVIGDKIDWHLIGQLQSNKVRHIIDKVTLIHSVDRLSLCKEIQKRAAAIDKTVEVLVQVNVSKEESKSGVYVEDAPELIKNISKNYPNIKVVGLMTMAPFVDDEKVVRGVFAGLKKLSDEISGMNIENVTMRELSMGMTHDFKIAIEEGATIVRVGTAIFGERVYK